MIPLNVKQSHESASAQAQNDAEHLSCSRSNSSSEFAQRRASGETGIHCKAASRLPEDLLVGKLGVTDVTLPLAVQFEPGSQFSHLTLWMGSQGKDGSVLFSGCGSQPSCGAKRWCVMCHRITEGHLPVGTKQFKIWDLSHKEKMIVTVVV